MDTLTEQVIHGAYAREALREAENLMALISRWDLMFDDEREREYEKWRGGAPSPFAEVPGFLPRWCANCEQETHFDFKEDPEGACGKCGAWAGEKA